MKTSDNNNQIAEEQKKIITKIAENWFLREPLLFGVYCTHKLTENTRMKIPFFSLRHTSRNGRIPSDPR